MATYIVDATIVMNYLISDEYTTNAQAFFDSTTKSDRLIVPEFCLLECTNVLWKQVRFHGMLLSDAESLLRDLRRLPLRLTPVKRILDAALRIGLRNELAIYDSVYIAFALRSGTPLLTVDQKQSNAATSEGALLKSITDFV